MFTNTPATLYSRSVSNGQETWSSASISAVYWSSSLAHTLSQVGYIKNNRFTVFVPLGNAPSAGFKEGDVLVKGTATKTITTAYTISNLKSDYPQSGVITEIDINDAGSPGVQHYELGVD